MRTTDGRKAIGASRQDIIAQFIIEVVMLSSAVGVSGGIGIVFAVISAHRAAKLDPIVALGSN
jgi:putative ABC transport system permease protein